MQLPARYNSGTDTSSQVAALFEQARQTVPDLDREAFAAALRRSAEKAGVSEPRWPAYWRTLKLPDLALATACVAGSETAWKTLVETMRGPLRAAGRALAGDRGEELADSLFGEWYSARQSKLGSYGGRCSLAGWLRALLHQAWIDRWRAGKKLVALDDATVEAAAPPVPDAVEEAEAASIAQQALGRALAELPPRQKLLLDFYYFHGLTLREAASLTGVHEATASRELDRARAALKISLCAILRREHGMEDSAIEAFLLSAKDLNLPAQEAGAANVLLKE